MIKLSYLEWDSVFFEKKIGRIDCRNSISDLSTQLAEKLRSAKSEDYDLLYVFCDGQTFIEDELLLDLNGKLVDRKVIFKGNIDTFNNSYDTSSNIVEYKSQVLDADLLKLAYISGEFSRFKTDDNFESDSFYQMYKVWINKSINKENADVVFVSKDGADNLVGMVTVKLKSDCAEMGLIAVDTTMQSSGIGQSLVERVKKYASDNNKNRLELATQKDNIKACNFYQKCGLIEDNVTNIYHFWLK